MVKTQTKNRRECAQPDKGYLRQNPQLTSYRHTLEITAGLVPDHQNKTSISKQQGLAFRFSGCKKHNMCEAQ